jgi:RNA polymerase sigma-70 factor (ECF subfamily)
MSRQTRGAALAACAEANPRRRLADSTHPGLDEIDSDSAGNAAWAPAQGLAQLDALYRRHKGWLSACLRLRYGSDEAEDLLQETFLKAAASRQLPDVRQPRPWLLAIALNLARDQHRRRAARPPAAGANDADGEVERLGVFSGQYEAVLLKQVILSLPPRLREVMLLSRFAGLTYEEIARRLGISTKTVEARMTKALAICSTRLRS